MLLQLVGCRRSILGALVWCSLVVVGLGRLMLKEQLVLASMVLAVYTAAVMDWIHRLKGCKRPQGSLANREGLLTRRQ